MKRYSVEEVRKVLNCTEEYAKKFTTYDKATAVQIASSEQPLEEILYLLVHVCLTERQNTFLSNDIRKKYKIKSWPRVSIPEDRVMTITKLALEKETERTKVLEWACRRALLYEAKKLGR